MKILLKNKTTYYQIALADKSYCYILLYAFDMSSDVRLSKFLLSSLFGRPTHVLANNISLVVTTRIRTHQFFTKP